MLAIHQKNLREIVTKQTKSGLLPPLPKKIVEIFNFSLDKWFLEW